MYGLRMKREYLDEILSGKKNSDARLSDTSIRGEIGLIDIDTNEILGIADLIGTKVINFEEYINWHISSSFDILLFFSLLAKLLSKLSLLFASSLFSNLLLFLYLFIS